jgi:hypothetical protein
MTSFFEYLAVVVLFAAIFFSGTCTGVVVGDEKILNGDISRGTHRCEIDGRRLNCQMHSAWFTGSRCRCITDRVVIRWSMDDEE